jgi:hypothetical protein
MNSSAMTAASDLSMVLALSKGLKLRNFHSMDGASTALVVSSAPCTGAFASGLRVRGFFIA